MNSSELPGFERKIPKQARARHTRSVIFEATARIIEQGRALNTNAIAARAGISIGTLYGHFASKEAVLVSMARQQLAQDETTIVEAVCQESDPAISRARKAVRALVFLHTVRPEVRRTIMAAHAAHGLSAERATTVCRATQRITAWRRQFGRVDDSAMFVATRAVVGTVGAAFAEASPLLGSPQFEDELTALIERCFVRGG